MISNVVSTVAIWSVFKINDVKLFWKWAVKDKTCIHCAHLRAVWSFSHGINHTKESKSWWQVKNGIPNPFTICDTRGRTIFAPAIHSGKGRSPVASSNMKFPDSKSLCANTIGEFTLSAASCDTRKLAINLKLCYKKNKQINEIIKLFVTKVKQHIYYKY